MAVTVVLNKAEALVIWRRRQKLGQIPAARMHNVNPGTWRKWEAGGGTEVPLKYNGVLTVQEQCYILRRRKGLTQEQLGQLLGVSKVWVIKMEEGSANCDRLLAHFGVKKV